MTWNGWKVGLWTGFLVQAVCLALAMPLLDSGKTFKVLSVLYVTWNFGVASALIVGRCKERKLIAFLVCLLAPIILFVAAANLRRQVKLRAREIELPIPDEPSSGRQN